jgi:hypothetical protein
MVLLREIGIGNYLMMEVRPSYGGYASLHDSRGARDQPHISQTFPAWSALRWALFAPFVLAGNIAVSMLAWFVVDLLLH